MVIQNRFWPVGGRKNISLDYVLLLRGKFAPLQENTYKSEYKRSK